jgi:hypothetical protein
MYLPHIHEAYQSVAEPEDSCHDLLTVSRIFVLRWGIHLHF